MSGLSVLPSPGLFKTPYFEELRSASSDDELFSLVRKQLYIPAERIYLNTGSLGPSPMIVTDTVADLMRQLEMNPAIENWGELGKRMEEVRSKVASLINAETQNIVLTRNTTEGLSMIGQTLKLKSGDEILTTTHEHGGGEVGLEYLERTCGAKIKKVQLPMPVQRDGDVIKAIADQISAKTKVVMLSHVNTLTGMRMPLAEISKITKPKNIILIADGAQAPGLIKVDVNALGVDAYAASGHKWMLGPKETGFVYWSEGLQNEINPVFTSSGFESYSASSGTRNVALISGLGVAIDWLNTIGVEKIEQRCLETRNYCYSKLSAIESIKMISPQAGRLSTGIVSFELKQGDNRTVAKKLADQNIIVKVLPKYNGIRISCHMFVSKNDIDLFVEALTKVI